MILLYVCNKIDKTNMFLFFARLLPFRHYFISKIFDRYTRESKIKMREYIPN